MNEGIRDLNWSYFTFLAVEIMICVFHTREAKHGQDHLDIRCWTSGGHGLWVDKLLGMHVQKLKLIHNYTLKKYTDRFQSSLF